MSFRFNANPYEALRYDMPIVSSEVHVCKEWTSKSRNILTTHVRINKWLWEWGGGAGSRKRSYICRYAIIIVCASKLSPGDFLISYPNLALWHRSERLMSIAKNIPNSHFVFSEIVHNEARAGPMGFLIRFISTIIVLFSQAACSMPMGLFYFLSSFVHLFFPCRVVGVSLEFLAL